MSARPARSRASSFLGLLGLVWLGIGVVGLACADRKTGSGSNGNGDSATTAADGASDADDGASENDGGCTGDCPGDDSESYS